ncbi:MAG: polymer-forming cytoskeletal protein [Zetaproteobacteria bacterium]|nr:MAG: polymer-forming cytoskeletal protein [Zetaproteobacteria bacterium]
MKHRDSITPTGSENQNIDTLIGEHSHFNGELSFEGAVRIDGKFEGNIRSTNEGTLIVSEEAQIIGEVDVPNLLLHGTVRGNVRATKSLKIGPTGRLNGDVEYSVVSLAEGAAVNGRCNRIEDKERVKQAAKTSATVSGAEHSPQPA